MSSMPIEPIAPTAPGMGLGDLAGTTGSDAVSGLQGAGGLAAPATTSGSAEIFAGNVAEQLQSLQQAHSTVDALAMKAVTGQLTDVHDYTIAATQAQLATELTVTMRNKALEAFTEIMRMPV